MADKRVATIKRLIKKAYPDLSESDPPQWLKKARWGPSLVLRKGIRGKILAVDIALSGTLPLATYKKDVAKLMKERSNLRVLVCFTQEMLANRGKVKHFCETRGIGMKVHTSGLGLRTVVGTDLDPVSLAARLPEEEGFFPLAILEQVCGLKAIDFASTLDAFVSRIRSSAKDYTSQLNIVRETIDELLKQNPCFDKGLLRFMALENFERWLGTASPESSDHVLHSFRVFLAGCPLVNQFYQVFADAHRQYCICDPAEMRVEYTWLLASLFHDIGRLHEGMAEVVKDRLDDDVELVVRDDRWARSHYRTSLQCLGSLGAYVGRGVQAGWDGGVVADRQGEALADEWTDLYGRWSSHAVISAIDILADIFEKAEAADLAAHRSFVVTHAAPAALAILLHDWRIGDKARRWRLVPVNGQMLPLAALLMYIDTWDDFRRKGEDQRVAVISYDVDSGGARVEVLWRDSDDLLAERMKYDEFQKALYNLPFKLSIVARGAGMI